MCECQRLKAETNPNTLWAVPVGLDCSMGGPSQRLPGENAPSRRRANYLITHRTDKFGFRLLYDAADPVSIVDQRAVATGASKSLFLPNDPFRLEQFRALVDWLLSSAALTSQ